MTSERRPASLIERARAGDDAAREELVKNLQRPLYDYFLVRTRRRQVSEDLLQNTLIKVLTRLPQLRQDSAFRGWAYAIARSELLDQMKNRQGKNLELDGETAAPAETPLEEVLAKEQDRELARAIDRLSPRQREVVLLRVRQELSFAEIAGLLEISEENARVSFHQAVGNLRLYLNEKKEGLWTATDKAATTPY